jgi:hypothetical protein
MRDDRHSPNPDQLAFAAIGRWCHHEPPRLNRGVSRTEFEGLIKPMAARVKLRDVIDAMDLPNQDWQSYLNRDTCEIVTVTDEDRSLVEDDADLDGLPDWQREALPRIREALESNRFLLLPGSFELHEWSIMERFGQERGSARQRDELLDSLHGRGAFRMFKSAIRRLRIEEEWYRFRDSAFEEIAKDWLESNGLEYE